VVEFFSVEEVLQNLLNLGNPGAAAHQHDFVNVGLLESAVFEHPLHWSKGPLEQINAQVLKLCAGQLLLEIAAIPEVVDLDRHLFHSGQLSLGLLYLQLKLGDSGLAGGDVDSAG